MPTENRPVRKKKKKNRALILVIEIVALLVVVIVAGVVWFAKSRVVDRINFVDKITVEDAGINELDEHTEEVLSGYTNILLLGLDNRSEGNYNSGNSDTIMIASIDNATHDVRLVSVYRDTLLCIGNNRYRKANAAFSGGGAVNTIAMINSNLDLNITEFVCVDWAALVECIDDLGGLDLNLTSLEVQKVNETVADVDQVTGKHTPVLSGSGMLHLDGTQAVCYARIRKTQGDDFLRTSRQRIVLQEMLSKAKGAGVTSLLSIIDDVADDISTTLTLSEMYDLAKNVAEYNVVETTGFPFDLTTKTLSGIGDTVIPCVLTNNVVELHSFLFGDEEYQPSASVVDHNANIINLSGISSPDAAINIDQYNDTTGANGTNFKDE